MSSPQSEFVTKSPGVPPESASNGTLSPTIDAEAASSPDVNRRRLLANTSSNRSTGTEREKRKRSRVTPDQLVHLERFFSMDRSPTAARRREISELLGMQERQTQIWFQNRRAKAKLLNGKGKSRTDSTPPTTPPDLLPGYDVDLHSLIHESEPVTIIPCTDLTIGTWRRIATQVSKHDLVAYVCGSRKCLIWFIHSAGYGFKMEIPFGTIVDTEFVNAAPGSGLASFFLARPPLFYLEDLVAPPTGGPPVRTWKRCADWTEGMQASKVLRHDLVGSAVQLAHVIRNLQAALPSSDVRLRGGPYMRSDLASGQSLDTNSITLTPSLPGQTHGYRPPFGGSAVDTGREEMATDVQKRYSFPGVHPQPVNAPSDGTTFGDPLGTSPHSHLGLTDSSSSSSPVIPYPPYPPLSAASSHSHLGNYPDVSSSATPGQSSSPPYLGQQGQGYHIPAPPASAPPSHTHFELAPTPPPPSLAPQPPQQQYQRHQPTSQMLGQPSIPVPLPFGNGFDTSGHRGE
ncbi:hypothetical protein BGW80DRAFT_1437428 [Lactifluus volemus]|nr:hypothetical protein BGW80DRAFT_1437428 [Lactifluus volemus]